MAGVIRDIRYDLHERINLVREQIRADEAQFEVLIAQLRKEQDSRLEDLRAQLQAVTRLGEIATWQHNVRMAVARALALAATVEMSTATAAHQISQAPTAPGAEQGSSDVRCDMMGASPNADV